MRSLLIAIGCSAVIACGTTLPSTGGIQPLSDSDASEFYRRYEAALKAHRGDTLANFYHSDGALVVLNGVRARRTYLALDSAYRQRWRGPVFFAFDSLRFESLASEQVLVTGSFRWLNAQSADTGHYAYLSILSRTPAGLKIRVEHETQLPRPRTTLARTGATAPSFDGADYATATQKVAHGERLAELFGCSGCHGQDYTGNDFGKMFPVVEGLWASNISLTMPAMSDADLERLLRKGLHPTREIYLMPSKHSQFLSGPDMNALIAFLRTIKPTGKPTPLPPADFEQAVTARLPADYWRTTPDGRPRNYHNSAEEVAYFAENTVPDLGVEFAQGRLVVQVTCTGCHGAAMDGVGEPAGHIQGALQYSDAEFLRLLRDGVSRDGKTIEMPFPVPHTSPRLTDSEIASAIAYTRALARLRKGT